MSISATSAAKHNVVAMKISKLEKDVPTGHGIVLETIWAHQTSRGLCRILNSTKTTCYSWKAVFRSNTLISATSSAKHDVTAVNVLRLGKEPPTGHGLPRVKFRTPAINPTHLRFGQSQNNMPSSSTLFNSWHAFPQSIATRTCNLFAEFRKIPQTILP
jgi:hypothetical protein